MSAFDAEAHRRASLENWEDASVGWVRRREMIGEWGRAVSQWLVAALDPQPGQRLLELAAGLGETGMLAAEGVAPAGSVILSDQAEGMLAGARELATERGVRNVEFQVLNAEWIDLSLASIDGVLCRYGYMLMADPAAALAETRRVLRPGGRIALAVWDSIDANPWAGLPAVELLERGLGQAPGSDTRPGPFALGSGERVVELLAGAGFTEPRVETVSMLRRHRSFEEYWEVTLDLSRSFHDAVMAQPAEEIGQIRAALERRLAPYAVPGGGIELPGRTLVACAEA
ncbi:MAG TPA: methyltransferase domain-containing protein [Solirubrobacteraceae bacterium]|jgi:SAM-dependent methyltransferase